MGLLDSLFACKHLISINIEGSASPDGPARTNFRLARGRAEAFKSYILRNTNISDSLFTVNVIGENWEGLKKLYPATAEFIRKYPSADAREAALKRYRNGSDWAMLCRDIFPQLRYVIARARYSRTGTPDSEIKSLEYASVGSAKPVVKEVGESPVPGPAVIEVKETPAKDTINSPPAPPVTPVSPVTAPATPADTLPATAWQRHLYIKTNAPAWGMLISNIAAEIDLDPHWSFSLPIYYSALNYFKTTVKFRTFGIQPEIRYWLKENNDGWFVGAHLGMIAYNWATDGKYRIQDHKGHCPALGGGLTAGYRLPISKNKRWKMEFSLGAGVYALHYDRFRNHHNGLLVDTKKKAYWGIDQAAVSFAYTFDIKKKGGAK